MSIGIYNEFDIVQNKVLGFHGLYEFLKEFTESNKGIGPKIHYLFPVLPILFNEESAAVIYSKNLKPGSFIKVLSEKSDIFSTLQIKMQDQSVHTLHCINLGIKCGLIGYDPESTRVFIQAKKNPGIQLSADYQKILFAAKRLGAWFAKMSEEEILIYLNIRF
ncbi:three component ABC system middle component [Mucilaginibacter rubeus]|uniref:Uncharacterized protein n=1 Tax=Mucilaginibacter rubeus TaxID=2027860 RepID=A0A5C1I2B2_9SPHI|nr:three component ABC system middle component [Mucilaginibacter rubeus]QEM12377.1 hypothetical protein DEO27_020935 [Mucilaginibacter rubeus]